MAKEIYTTAVTVSYLTTNVVNGWTKQQAQSLYNNQIEGG